VEIGAGFAVQLGAGGTLGWKLQGPDGPDRTASLLRAELGVTWSGP
jgi:hypothetical protein